MSTKAACRPRLLWFDLTSSQSAEQCIQQFVPQCQVTLAYGLDNLPGPEDKPLPDMLCLHFDRPDSGGLNLLLEVKRRLPSVPITMLTMQHSEELAVWAFRSGVWEYLVVPLSSAERLRYLKSLRELHDLRQRPSGSNHRQRPARVEQLPECVRLNRGQHAQQPLYAALAHIDGHFRERIEEREMAELCGMSVVRFSRLFKQSCGIGFQEYVVRKRMQAAEELLINSNIPISSVAYMVGFKDPSYFARAFRQHFGHSPSTCRQAQRQTEELPPLPNLDGLTTELAL
ncbi:helix-turn-helix domain-containing protein [Pseudomonas stutzeri]|nr:helix-turn-helix domain-containing protein [Stutzerimonas stutzeri]